MRSRPLWSRNEEGVVLALCLITLVILTLIGVSATTTSRLEVEISGNDKTYKEAFYAAELSLTVGETVLNSLLSRVELQDGTQPGRYMRGTQPVWDQLVWDATHTVAVTSIPSGLSTAAAAPRYTIEERTFRRDSLTVGLGVTTGAYDFTVRGLGTGASKDAHTFLESVYAKRFD